MTGIHGSTASSLVVLLCFGATPALQAERTGNAPSLERLSTTASRSSLPRGSIRGVVRNQAGDPVAGALVSVVGLTGASATTDQSGQYILTGLPAGAYLLRVRLDGYLPPSAQFVSVGDAASSVPSIVLRDAGAYPVLAAGIGAIEAESPRSGPTPVESRGEAAADDREKTGATAWRMRHLRRSVLKSTTAVDDLLTGLTPDAESNGMSGALLRAADAPVRAAFGLFADLPWSGQVNLMTAGSFDEPHQRLSDTLTAGAGVAYLRIGSPVGSRADWNIEGALTNADIASWVLSGTYTTRTPSRHQYDVGVSYSTQLYSGGNPLALRDLTDGSRNVGTIRGFDRVTLAPAVSLSYGARYERYDYLEQGNLLSPKVGIELAPSWARVRAEVSSRALAPGAEEFLPPGEAGLLLPPQRTFSSIDRRRLRAERANQATVAIERDVAGATLAVRGFRQRVSDQLATWFDATLPGESTSDVGHYLLANVGTVYATGWAASVHAVAKQRLSGTIEYSSTKTRLTTDQGRPWWVAGPDGGNPMNTDRVQNIAAALEATVPESATRVMVTYRVTTGLPTPPSPVTGLITRGTADTRFDVQIRQSLPFLDSRTGRWEMLLLVRNFFREVGADQAVFDEMFVVRPPKRVVGGLSLYF